MQMPQRWRVVIFAAVATGAGIALGLSGWPQPGRASEFSGLILSAVLISALARQSITAEDRGMMPASFFVDFSALCLLGGYAALFVAAAGTVTRWLSDGAWTRPRRTLLNAATTMTATGAAALAYGASGGAPGSFTWPWQGLPIAAAVVAYCVVKSLSAEVIAPLLNNAAINRSGASAVIRQWPDYFIAASAAVGLVAIVSLGMWDLLPLPIVPLLCAYRIYCTERDQFEEEFRRREVIGSLNQGMTVIDADGRVTLWNDALEQITDCPRERVLGRSLVSVIPAFAQTQLPRAVQEALSTRTPRSVTDLALTSSSGARVLEVKILPVADGVTLLWHDVTDRARPTRR